jgi:hypothetical protein
MHYATRSHNALRYYTWLQTQIEVQATEKPSKEGVAQHLTSPAAAAVGAGEACSRLPVVWLQPA